MKNKLALVFIYLFSISLYCQDAKVLKNKLRLSEEDKSIEKYYTFLELLEKSIKYKEANRQEEFEYNAPLGRWFNEFQFTERIFDNLIDKNVIKEIKYHIENKKLKFKTINNFSLNNSTVYFNNNGKLIDYYSYRKLNKKNKKNINSFFGYELPNINIKKNKIKNNKLIEIKNRIRRILTDKDSIKDFADFDNFTLKNLNDFKIINKILKKELKLDVLKNKEIHFVWMGSNEGFLELDLSDTNGTFYNIYENLEREKNKKSLSLYIRSPNRDFYTLIVYHNNGNIKSICQQELENRNQNKLLGLNSEYEIDGKIIREVNLEKEFKLSEDSLYSIVRNNKICTYRKDFFLRYVNRRLTNYGKLWVVNVHCYGNPTNIFINDSTSEIYTGEFEYYSSDEYKLKYGETNYKDIEKKINKNIFIYSKLNCE